MKRLIKTIFVLPPVWTLLISVPAYVLVIMTLCRDDVNPAVAYMSYGLSSYALVITVTGIIRAVCLVRRGMGDHPLVKKAMDIPMVVRYVREERFRAETALYQGCVINCVYAGIKLFSGVRYGSPWFITLGVYYLLLAFMRLALIPGCSEPSVQENMPALQLQRGSPPTLLEGEAVTRHVQSTGREDRTSQWRRYRLCGVVLLLMNVVLTGMVILVIHENQGFVYPGMLIYVMAMYGFYAVITAVRNVVRFRKYKNPVLSAAKVISLTAALVSMFSLETAMLTQFGGKDDMNFRRLMTALTGGGMSIMVVGMAVYMMVHAAGQLREEA